jgi:hypothetical protein
MCPQAPSRSEKVSSDMAIWMATVGILYAKNYPVAHRRRSKTVPITYQLS